MIKAVLFDLDGTLLPMDNDEFTKYYFSLLCKKLAPLGYEPDKVVDTIWKGTYAMIKNTGEYTNEEAFWKVFASLMGEEALKDRPIFDDFYRNEFNGAKAVCGYNQKLVDLVKELKEKGYRVVLATNPLFPSVATENRIHWAGFEPSDFELYTTYENINFCKPNPDYYREVLRRIGCTPEECIMVGNDVSDDMVAKQLGMDVFLLTDHLLNKKNEDISVYPQGDADALKKYLLG